jgi:hypothetical protein
MNTKEKAPKLTVTEKRALEYCRGLIHNQGGAVSVDWANSRTWGANPRIEHLGGKCSNISGCGYDKLSACLAEVLRFLFPLNSKAHSDVHGTGGAGESAVSRALREYGWNLTKTASGKMYDVFSLAPVNGEDFGK